MNTNKTTAYWLVKSFISFFMLFTAYFSYSHPQYLRFLGFPDYFRIELVAAKAMGAIALLIRQVPLRVKEWVYVGFIIVMVSAIIAHICSRDELFRIVVVLIEFALVLFSIRFVSRKENYKIN
jgi:putative oxidoreductase